MAFLTNFDLKQLPIYQQAVSSWPSGKDFAVSNRDNEKNLHSGMGSLHYFGKAQDLGPFWVHFEEVRKHKEQK